MKLSYKTTVITSVLLASLPTAQAAPEGPFAFSANVALTSDYLFRGITQTDGGFAIQGGFDINHETGFYIGTWGSNLKFLEGNTVKAEDRADIELDLYIGFAKDLGNGFSYNVKAGQYLYPGAGSDLNYDMTEFNVTLKYSMPQGTAFDFQYDFSPDFAGADEGHNYMFGVNHTLSSGLGFRGFVGQQNIEDNKASGKDDYLYYGLSLSFPVAKFNGSIAYSNTDLDNAEALGADGRVVFTLSKSF
jgi:uncharacterized protein (TIGR02001 family)